MSLNSTNSMSRQTKAATTSRLFMLYSIKLEEEDTLSLKCQVLHARCYTNLKPNKVGIIMRNVNFRKGHNSRSHSEEVEL